MDHAASIVKTSEIKCILNRRNNPNSRTTQGRLRLSEASLLLIREISFHAIYFRRRRSHLPRPAPLLHSQAVQPIQRLQQARPENQSPLRQEKSEEHANLDDRKSLLDALGKTLNSASTDMPDLDLTRFAVSPDSSMGRELKLINPAHVSLNWFIKHQGWIAPTNKEALQNLYDAITYAPPPQPAHRDYWECCRARCP